MVNNFTWHEVSEKEREKIKSDSKKLLDDFSKKLEKIKSKEKHFSQERGFREEGEPWKIDEEFKETMFSNAPFVEDNLIVAERGGWK
jgi:long-subunit acyl-CoA synthetase (AMP-forming)